MAEWIEVPAHRIYVCSLDEYEKRFIRIGKDGQPCDPFDIPELIYRDDGKRFRHAQFVPFNANHAAAVPHYQIFLEEI